MKKIAFIGCGNMGEALLKGVLEKRLFKKPQIMVSDTSVSKRAYIKKSYGVKTVLANSEAAKAANIILLCVKPQDMEAVLGELRFLLRDKLIITVAAGIATDYIKKKTFAKRIVRAMPNTPALVGCGITVISIAKGLKPPDINIADRIFSCVGSVVQLREDYLNAVTAVSGSGPAYFFLLMEALIETAVSLGIDKDTAETLVTQTAYGASLLQYKTKLHPSILRQNVTSKGGTTEAALKVFKNRKFAEIVKAAVRAAAKRAKELSK